MAVVRPGIGRTLAFGAAIALALSLAACGRKGPLDLPPSDTPSPTANRSNLTQPALSPSSFLPGSSTPDDTKRPNTVDAQGHAIYQPPPQGKSFILDPLLQ